MPLDPSRPRLFISYRRSDTEFLLPYIESALVHAFRVTSDAHIPPGSDFRVQIDAMLSACDCVLVVMGDRWIEARDPHGLRRIDDPRDFVRIEVECALARGVRVVPLLLGSPMPPQSSLPPSLAGLAYRNAVVVPRGSDLAGSLAALVQTLRTELRARESAGRVRVFIGRAPGDSGFTEATLAPLLARHGFDAWYWRGDLSSPEDWEAAVLPALEASDCCIFVASRIAVNDPWIRMEIAWALRNRPGRVISVRPSDVDPSERFARLDGQAEVDFSVGLDAASARLVGRISHLGPRSRG